MDKKITVLKDIVSRLLDLDVNNINDELERDKLESWDSFNHLLLISEIEKNLRITIPLPEIEKIRSFKELREIVNKRST